VVPTFLEKSDKFSKIPSSHDLCQNEFSWVHLDVRFRVTKQVPNDLVQIKETCLNLKFNPYNISWMVKLARISFKLPNYIVSYYSGIIEHCSSYSDTRGVTVIVGLERAVAWAGGGGRLLFRRWPVVALPGGFLAKVRGKTESLSTSDALQPEERTQVAAESRGGVELGFRPSSLNSWHGRNYLLGFLVDDLTCTWKCIPMPSSLRFDPDLMKICWFRIGELLPLLWFFGDSLKKTSLERLPCGKGKALEGGCL
jgi:hypothetical protein